MHSFQKINNVSLDLKYSFAEFFLKKNFGIKNFFLKKIKLRFEVFSSGTFNNLEKHQMIAFSDLLTSLFPQNLFFINYFLLNIIFLDFAYSYKGWRHLMGLPVNGQRTWSNSKSCYSANKFLRDYKFKLGKLFFGRSAGSDLQLILMSEYLNMLWRKQWFLEWSHARTTLKKGTKKKGVSFKFDLNATARGWIGNLKKNNPKLGKKKKKTLTGTLGFDPGFMKTYLNFKELAKKKKNRNLKKK